MEKNMQATAAAEGISIVYDGFTSNTLLAHRLIAWAKGKGRQNEVVEQIFLGYFTRGKAPADQDMLVQAAVDAGLDAEEARTFLTGSELKDAVLEEAQTVKYSYGVTGVPFFVVHADGSNQLPIGVPGAQEPETLVKVVQEALKDASPTPVSKQ
eukprot:m.20929 g.20929  ORF g.20929 m.20929 type:complete len:154 (+) comp3842_c0_seq1:289-750(+)